MERKAWEPMISILFWNVGNRPLLTQISDLAVHYDVDVILLAEAPDQVANLLERLNRTSASYSYVEPIGCTKISIYARFAADYIRPIYERDRLTIRRLNPPASTKSYLP